MMLHASSVSYTAIVRLRGGRSIKPRRRTGTSRPLVRRRTNGTNGSARWALRIWSAVTRQRFMASLSRRPGLSGSGASANPAVEFEIGHEQNVDDVRPFRGSMDRDRPAARLGPGWDLTTGAMWS
jgi:hypothetical protein